MRYKYLSEALHSGILLFLDSRSQDPLFRDFSFLDRLLMIIPSFDNKVTPELFPRSFRRKVRFLAVPISCSASCRSIVPVTFVKNSTRRGWRA